MINVTVRGKINVAYVFIVTIQVNCAGDSLQVCSQIDLGVRKVVIDIERDTAMSTLSRNFNDTLSS